MKATGYADFADHLFTGGIVKKGVSVQNFNTVHITMTGNYAADFALANKAAGFSKTPNGYTWHHTEFLGELQLISTAAHEAAKHSGGVQLYREQNNGKGY